MLHQVGVSFDLYYDARKHKIKIKIKITTHIETRTHDQCGDTIEKSQAPDDGCINVRNMLSIEEVK